jgi:hypothetical protein
MRIDSAGKVGIGTSAPDNLLHLFSSGVSVELKLECANSEFLIQAGNYGDDGLHFYDVANSAYRMMITNAGKVGIGETAPLTLLHVRTADSGAGVSSAADELYLENSGGCGMTIASSTSTDGSIFFADSGGTGVGRIVYSHNVNDLILFTNNSERMRINSDGGIELMGTKSGKQMAIITGSSTTGASHTHDITIHSGYVSGFEILATESHAAGNWDSFRYAILSCEPSNSSTTTHTIGSYGNSGQTGTAPTFAKTTATNMRITFNAGSANYGTRYYIRVITIGV